MNIVKTTLFAAIAATAMFAASAAHAETKSDTFQVKIEIQGSCDIISTEDVDFATHFANPGLVEAQGAVIVQCTTGQAYQVQLDGGTNADVTDRQMVGAANSDTINYQLYSNSGRTQVWGENLGTDTVDGTGTGFGTGAPFDQALIVYGVATLVGNETVDTYADTITATINF